MKFIFEVHIKPGHTAEQYADAWVRVSEILQRAPGALGTRLHRKIGDPGVLLAIAFRLPPRWASLLTLGAVMIAAALAAARPDSILGESPIARMLVLQTYLILMAALPLIVGMLVTSMRLALDQVSASEARYRTFIEMSSEAVWRIEIEPPMPDGITLDAQRQWLPGRREQCRLPALRGGLHRTCAPYAAVDAGTLVVLAV